MTTFELTEQHVALLRHAYVEWWGCETGAPAIDCKRPYGNSYVPGDVWEIVHGTASRELTDDEETAMAILHRQTETALQVILATGSFEPGVYEAPRWGDGTGWRRVSADAERAATGEQIPVTVASDTDESDMQHITLHDADRNAKVRFTGRKIAVHYGEYTTRTVYLTKKNKLAVHTADEDFNVYDSFDDLANDSDPDSADDDAFVAAVAAALGQPHVIDLDI